MVPLLPRINPVFSELVKNYISTLIAFQVWDFTLNSFGANSKSKLAFTFEFKHDFSAFKKKRKKVKPLKRKLSE